MPIINRIAEFHDEITAWRHDFHANPELMYDVHRTELLPTSKAKTTRSTATVILPPWLFSASYGKLPRQSAKLFGGGFESWG